MAEVWELLEPLGEGGAGTVFRARYQGDGGFERQVAVKMLTQLTGRSGALALLQREARNLARVQHRAVVRVDRLVQIDGTWALVMELVPGCSLAAALVDGAATVRAGLELVEELAGALHAAVTTTDARTGSPLQLVHCDLKPGNIQLTPHGEPRLLDFGVARIQGEGGGPVSGTPGYMSPERWRGVVRPAADVYGLGCVLFEMWTGERFGRCSLREGAHTERVQSAKGFLVDRGVPAEAAEWWTALVAERPENRPTAQALQSEAGRLSRDAPGQRLRDWAPTVMPEPCARPEHTHQDAPHTVAFTQSWAVEDRPGTEPTSADTGDADALLPRRDWKRPALASVTALAVAGWLFSSAKTTPSTPSPRPIPGEPSPHEPVVSAPLEAHPEAVVPSAPEPTPAPVPRRPPQSRASEPALESPPPTVPAPELPAPEPPPQEAAIRSIASGPVVLRSSTGRIALPARVPPGRYDILLRSDLGEMEAGTLDVDARDLRIDCDMGSALCWSTPEGPG